MMVIFQPENGTVCIQPDGEETFHFSAEISTADFRTLLFFGFLMMFSNFMCRWAQTIKKVKKGLTC